MILLESAYLVAEPISLLVLGIIGAVATIGTGIYQTERGIANQKERISAVAIYDLPEKENQNLIIFSIFILVLILGIFLFFLTKK
jgi:hypothetical protein